MKKLTITVTNNISYDQRMQKIANHLAERFDVTIIGSSMRNPPELNEESYQQKRLRTFFTKGFLFYAEFNVRLFFYLLTKKTDILYSVDLDTLFVAYCLNKIRGQKYIYDSHEYFTELPELVGRTYVQMVWRYIEKSGVPRAIARITVNDELARIFEEKYKVKFDVVQNTPVLNNPKMSRKENVFLYQGALNEGRGIEELIQVMKYFPDYTLEIAGGGPLEDKLKKLKEDEKADNVIFHGMLRPEQLKEIGTRAKIGFNLLLGVSLNYYYSLANKFFDYVMLEIPVITMKFPVYERLMNTFKVGEMLDELSVEELKITIEKILNDEGNYHEIIANCQEAKKKWNWKNELEILDRII